MLIPLYSFLNCLTPTFIASTCEEQIITHHITATLVGILVNTFKRTQYKWSKKIKTYLSDTGVFRQESFVMEYTLGVNHVPFEMFGLDLSLNWTHLIYVIFGTKERIEICSDGHPHYNQ